VPTHRIPLNFIPPRRSPVSTTPLLTPSPCAPLAQLDHSFSQNEEALGISDKKIVPTHRIPPNPIPPRRPPVSARTLLLPPSTPPAPLAQLDHSFSQNEEALGISDKESEVRCSGGHTDIRWIQVGGEVRTEIG
jgi:hypothetical protein